MEAAPGFEPGMRVLQTRALPLGDAASVTSGTRISSTLRERMLGIRGPKVNFHLQALARATAQVVDLPRSRGCSISIDPRCGHRFGYIDEI